MVNKIDTVTAFHWDDSPADLESKSKSKSSQSNFRALKAMSM